MKLRAIAVFSLITALMIPSALNAQSDWDKNRLNSLKEEVSNNVNVLMPSDNVPFTPNRCRDGITTRSQSDLSPLFYVQECLGQAEAPSQGAVQGMRILYVDTRESSTRNIVFMVTALRTQENGQEMVQCYKWIDEGFRDHSGVSGTLAPREKQTVNTGERCVDMQTLKEAFEAEVGR